MQYLTRPGSRHPDGATLYADGINFSVFSRHATSVALLLYEGPTSESPFQVIELTPDAHRTFFSWHVFVEGLPAGTYYAWRVDGPTDTRTFGFRFNKNKPVVDPWARAVSDALWDRDRAKDPHEASDRSIRAVVTDDGDYDWEGDEPLRHSIQDEVIYEMHVGGFTRHPSSAVSHPGTFDAVIEKIPYLKELGITAVELLPVMAFDEQDVPPAVANRGLKNYWGYSPHSFYAPHPGYCVAPLEATHRRQFRNMVKALHRADIAVILDVVFNHTAENGADGPVINFKGLGNESFYHLDPHDRNKYRDYTGCGNTVNCNHPLVARFLVECLEYWVREMHVDGFRFDLASVLARGEDGSPMYHAPVPWSIEFSDVLTHSTLIAEAWDAGGLYQVGGFPGFRWAEWNGQFRDTIRRFVRGEPGRVADVATRVTGSSDLYQPGGRLPINSINFVTCHDGFTLYDLVSYDVKHNQANGEDNRDGSNQNFSWNCGIEGDTADVTVQDLRRRQAKNFVAVLLLSQGVPMLLFGDEILRTQGGNNNAYCQDNELGWFDWSLTEANQEMLHFVREMVALRKRHRCLRRERFLTGQPVEPGQAPDIVWHGVRLNEPPWSDPSAQTLAYTLSAVDPDEDELHVIFNMSDAALLMDLPQREGRLWHRAVDTSLASPKEILVPADQPAITDPQYSVSARSVIVLEGRRHERY